MKRSDAYRICKERGHTPANYILASNPPQSKCKYCGTTYRHELVLVELDPPEEP